LNWLLVEAGVVTAIQAQHANLALLPTPPRQLHRRMLVAIAQFPCDVLFVHRDAERELPVTRQREIQDAVKQAEGDGVIPPVVCVIPVRMQEAWLLSDEPAIRKASGNPNGRMPLALPRISNIEDISNPKDTLHDLLKQASGLHGRDLAKFYPHRYAFRVAELTSDFSSLRTLSAFRGLEADIHTIVGQLGWTQ
jgi:hypothetical protein